MRKSDNHIHFKLGPFEASGTGRLAVIAAAVVTIVYLLRFLIPVPQAACYKDLARAEAVCAEPAGASGRISHPDPGKGFALDQE